MFYNLMIDIILYIDHQTLSTATKNKKHIKNTLKIYVIGCNIIHFKNSFDFAFVGDVFLCGLEIYQLNG